MFADLLAGVGDMSYYAMTVVGMPALPRHGMPVRLCPGACLPVIAACAGRLPRLCCLPVMPACAMRLAHWPPACLCCLCPGATWHVAACLACLCCLACAPGHGCLCCLACLPVLAGLGAPVRLPSGAPVASPACARARQPACLTGAPVPGGRPGHGTAPGRCPGAVCLASVGCARNAG